MATALGGLRWWSLGYRKVAKKIENNEIFLRRIGFTEKCCLISLVRHRSAPESSQNSPGLVSKELAGYTSRGSMALQKA